MDDNYTMGGPTMPVPLAGTAVLTLDNGMVITAKLQRFDATTHNDRPGLVTFTCELSHLEMAKFFAK